MFVDEYEFLFKFVSRIDNNDGSRDNAIVDDDGYWITVICCVGTKQMHIQVEYAKIHF